MLIKKYESSPLRFLQNEVDKLFEQSFNTTSQWMPEVDIVETDTELVFTAEMAGVDPKEVDLSLDNNELTIKGHKKAENTEENKGFHRIERRYGSFTRVFRLPQYVDAENIKAECLNGVLKVVFAKKESVKARKIEIVGADADVKTLSAKASS